eukprot:476280-Hanusia_phi.AAC.1
MAWFQPGPAGARSDSAAHGARHRDILHARRRPPGGPSRMTVRSESPTVLVSVWPPCQIDRTHDGCLESQSSAVIQSLRSQTSSSTGSSLSEPSRVADRRWPSGVVEGRT